MKLLTSLTISLGSLFVAAQRSFIGYPPADSLISPGQQLTVQVIRPVGVSIPICLYFILIIQFTEQPSRLYRGRNSHRYPLMHRNSMRTTKSANRYRRLQWGLQPRASRTAWSSISEFHCDCSVSKQRYEDCSASGG